MSIATYLTALDRDRDALAANLTTKGVPASSSETFTTLVPKVLDIPSGGGGTGGLTLTSIRCYPVTTSLKADGIVKVFKPKIWNGTMPNSKGGIWTDGTNIYFSYRDKQLILNKETSTWSTKTWSGLTSFTAQNIWSDGTNIYYSSGSTQYVLNKSTSTWSTKTWSGLTSFNGYNIWTNGTNIYYSAGNTQYVLNKSNNTWSTKTWSGLTSFNGYEIWSDGVSIYYSAGSTQYVLDKSTSTWSAKTWNFSLTNGANATNYLTGHQIWTDGSFIYFSAFDKNNSIYGSFVLDIDTSTWYNGGPLLMDAGTSSTSYNVGSYIWTDGTNIYYGNGDGSSNYVLESVSSVSNPISQTPVMTT